MARALSAALFVVVGIRVVDATTFTVTNIADSGAGSLRQAITDANSNPGADTIALLTVLPTVTEAVTIDGYTQAGSGMNTLASGDNAAIRIVLNGSTVEAN